MQAGRHLGPFREYCAPWRNLFASQRLKQARACENKTGFHCSSSMTPPYQDVAKGEILTREAPQCSVCNGYSCGVFSPFTLGTDVIWINNATIVTTSAVLSVVKLWFVAFVEMKRVARIAACSYNAEYAPLQAVVTAMWFLNAKIVTMSCVTVAG
jgi:hypothetical protein